MRITETVFDIERHHIHLEVIVINEKGIEYSVDAILDTGAPRTEFSDQFLMFTGFIDFIDESVKPDGNLQSKKYSKTEMPVVNICNQRLENLEVLVSSFEDSWGIDALIGLDFFRIFKIEIDYSRGIIITEPIFI